MSELLVDGQLVVRPWVSPEKWIVREVSPGVFAFDILRAGGERDYARHFYPNGDWTLKRLMTDALRHATPEEWAATFGEAGLLEAIEAGKIHGLGREPLT